MKKALSIIICVFLIAGAFSACVSGKTEKKEENTEPKLDFVCDFAYASDMEKAEAGYNALCKAVLNGDDSARLNTQVIESVRKVFYTSFPLSALVKDVKVKQDGSGVSIVYTQPKEEHIKSVSTFVEKINTITASCAASNPNIYALNVYHYVASNIKVSEDMTVKCYDTVVTGEGTSFSYAQMLSYLLMLGGVEAAYVTAHDNAKAGWGLCQVKLNGNCYYLDAMTEYYDNGGQVIRYFGMTDSDLKKEGLTEPEYSNSTVCADASDLYFDICRICKSYEIKGTDLLVSTTQGEVVKVAL